MKRICVVFDENGDSVMTTINKFAELYKNNKKLKQRYNFITSSWEEAMAIYHLREGLEPYKPEGEPSKCPKCGSWFYPKGSGECWNCDYKE